MTRLKTLFLFLVVLICSAAANPPSGLIIKGVVQQHPADSKIIYNWFSYVPNSLTNSETGFILVAGYGGLFDYNENTEQCRIYAENIKGLAETYKLVLLIPSVPRTNTPTDIYTIAFDRQSFSDPGDPMHYRPDLKVNKMIDHLTGELENEGYTVHPKVFIEGFSAGGMFAQRYALIHPTRVQAVAAGQCGGSLTLPVSIYNATSLTWAIGVSDFTALTGAAFNKFVYRQIPQFFYIGANDTTNSHFKWANPIGFWSQEQIDFINGLFGNTDPVRVEGMSNYMIDREYSVTFRKYAGIGHEVMPWNTPDIYTDIYSFLVQQKNFVFEDRKFDPALLNMLLDD